MLQLRIFFVANVAFTCFFVDVNVNVNVEFYAEFLEEILRNTQNFGRQSAEKVGRWSLWSEAFWKFSENSLNMVEIVVPYDHEQTKSGYIVFG